MPYPKAILAMAHNLIAFGENDPNNRLCMLWNAILCYHFPLDKNYGVAPGQTSASITSTGTNAEYLVVKTVHEEEHVVLVANIKKPSEDTEAYKEKLMMELVEYIEEQFDETVFSSIYGLGGIGLSWTAFRMDRAGSRQPQILVPWQSDITSSWAFDTLEDIVSDIHKMTTPRKKKSRSLPTRTPQPACATTVQD